MDDKLGWGDSYDTGSVEKLTLGSTDPVRSSQLAIVKPAVNNSHVEYKGFLIQFLVGCYFAQGDESVIADENGIELRAGTNVYWRPKGNAEYISVKAISATGIVKIFPVWKN